MQVTDKIRAIASREWSNPDSSIYAACDRLDAKYAALVEACEWANKTMEASGEELPDWLMSMRAALRAAKGDA